MEAYTFDPNAKKKEPKKEVEKERMTPVVSTKADEKKKNAALARLSALFIPEDVDDVKTYILKDIIIPEVKHVIIDSVKALLGESGSSMAGSHLFSERVSYGSNYRNRGNVTRYRHEEEDPRPERRDLKFRSRADAESVLGAMMEAIDVYSTVCMNDLYDFADRGDLCSPAGAKYGWKDLSHARVIPEGSGYIIKMPKAFPLD